jgi:phenylacetate-coenzyme A ligase PaaK-like adenylate-forming protein
MDIQIVVSLLSEMRQFRARDQWTRRQLEAHQANALRLVREYVYAHSPFYQQFHKGLYDAPLQELPVLTKAMMMEQFDELVTDRAIRLEEVKAHMRNLTGDERFLGRYRVNATSGSSGHPGIFLFNRVEWTTALASFARAREWGGVKLDLTRRVKTATIASTTPFHMSTRVNATVRSWWMPELRIAASEPLGTIVERLNTWQPEMLIAYASMARILADEQLAGRLQIRPRAVFSSSEVLAEETRRRIVQAWGERLFNQYAATECGSLAAECDHHRGMHLMEDLVIVEVVDQDNRPVSPGVYGDKLLITVLFNRSQPLIRYELSDSVRLSPDPCPSGHPFALIDDIQGRVEDVLSFPGAAGGVVNVHPLVFSRIMDTLPISGWQVIQEADRLRVLLSGVRGAFEDEALADSLRQALTEQGVLVPGVEVQRVTSIPKTAAGKAPLIKSNLSQAGIHPGTRSFWSVG